MKKRTKCKCFWIKDPVFLTAVTVFAGSKKNILDTMTKKIKFSNKDEATDTVMDDYMAKVCFFGSDTEQKEYTFMLIDTDECNISTISHEIFHLVYNALNRSGLKMSLDSEESYAYLIGWYTKEIYKKLGIKDGRIQII